MLDCLAFVRDSLQAHVPRDSGLELDPERIAVSGSSAGGYIAFMAGLHSDIPKVLLPIYPMTDPWGDFFTNPQLVKEPVATATVAPFLDKDAPAVADNDPNGPRQKMYDYMLQEANLARLWDVQPGDDRLIVPLAIRKKGAFRPCYVVHGDGDIRVGVEQADEAVEALKAVGCEVVYERPVGLEHTFDADPKYTMSDMYAFLYKHMA